MKYELKRIPTFNEIMNYIDNDKIKLLNDNLILRKNTIDKFNNLINNKCDIITFINEIESLYNIYNSRILRTNLKDKDNNSYSVKLYLLKDIDLYNTNTYNYSDIMYHVYKGNVLIEDIIKTPIKDNKNYIYNNIGISTLNNMIVKEDTFNYNKNMLYRNVFHKEILINDLNTISENNIKEINKIYNYSKEKYNNELEMLHNYRKLCYDSNVLIRRNK